MFKFCALIVVLAVFESTTPGFAAQHKANPAGATMNKHACRPGRSRADTIATFGASGERRNCPRAKAKVKSAKGAQSLITRQLCPRSRAAWSIMAPYFIEKIASTR
jgi:hypothetical protein